MSSNAFESASDNHGRIRSFSAQCPAKSHSAICKLEGLVVVAIFVMTRRPAIGEQVKRAVIGWW